ncbi:MAG TPA: hypothetical protein VGE45_04680 [Chloroflexia bacterium]|jgi:hypothetical protein
MRSSSIARGLRVALRAALDWLRGEVATWLRLLRWWPAWAALAGVLLGLTLAYQVPHTYAVDVGSAQDQLYVRNFHGRSEGETPSYRWSGVYSYVAFPGLGGGRPFTATLTLNPERTAPVTIIVNGETLFEGELQPGWQTLTLPVNEQHPGALASRDMVLEIRAPDYRTPDAPGQPKGVKLDSAVVEQEAVGGLITPAYSALALLSGGVLLFYLFVGRALMDFASLNRARSWALLSALSLGVTLAVLLAQSHVAVAAAASHLSVTLVSMILLFLAGNVIASRLVGRRDGAAHGLALCLALAFGVRYAGMALPQSVIIDMPWHMKWLRTLLAGDWQSLYFPGGLSAVPREWGLELLIPKSPLFYFAFAPLNLLPFDLETSTKWLICLLDATLVLAVFWLVLRVGGGRISAVMGAALYAFMPIAFRAFAYGILPTIFAQWLAVGTLVAFLALSGQRRRWMSWLAVTLLAALALVAFPTVAVFLTMVALASAALWWLMSRPRTVEWRVPLVLFGAWLLAVWGYYGLYISPMITSAQALIAPKAGGSTVRWPGGFADLLTWTADYVVTLLPALLAFLGLAFLLVRLRGKTAVGRSESVERTFWLLLAWASIAPAFLLVNYRVDMIGKHLFFTMLPVAAAGGVALWEFGRRGRWATALMVLAFGAIGWQALIFWVERLVRAST